MNRQNRNQVDTYYNRDISLHKPGVVPNSSRVISPIAAHRHKYELKRGTWPAATPEAWFATHSQQERRAVYSFLDTLNTNKVGPGNEYRTWEHSRRLSPNARRINRANSATTGQGSSRLVDSDRQHSSRASKRDLGEVLESLERFRPLTSGAEANAQTSSKSPVDPLPHVQGTRTDGQSDLASKRPATSGARHTEVVQPVDLSTPATLHSAEEGNNQTSRRYLSHTWRVINPRDDVETNVRPEHNSSSFFNYTKKVQPEYFFIHPDWY